MPCEVWIGEKPQYSSELKILASILEEINKFEEKFHVFINFYIPKQIDLIILKSEGIFLIELKDWHGTITAKFNGKWLVDGEELDQENPYYQVQKQYNELYSYLKKNKNKFLPYQKAFTSDFREIKSLILIPALKLHPSSEIHPKIEIVNKEDILRILIKEKAKNYHLSDEEISRLAQLLNLRKCPDIEVLIPHIDINLDIYLKGVVKELEELDKKYVPVSFTWIKKKDKNRIIETLSVDDLTDLVQEEKIIYIFGEPGSGKTTLAQKITYDYAVSHQSGEKEKFCIPIYIPLKFYDKEQGGITGLIKYSLNKKGIDIKLDVVRALVEKKKKFIFILDGLNEIAPDQIAHAIKDLRTFIRENYEAKYIITSRPEYTIDLEENSTELRINKLEQKAMEALVKNIFIEEIGHTVGLDRFIYELKNIFKYLPANPLFVTLAARVLLREKSRSPTSAAELFEEFILVCLERRKQSQPLMDKQILEMQLILSRLAFKMKEMGLYKVKRLQYDHLTQSIWQELFNENKIETKFSTLKAELDSSILLQRERKDVFFWHDMLQDYLASKRLVELMVAQVNEIEEYFLDFDWNQVCAFALNILDKKEINYLLDYAALGENYHLISLALSGFFGEWSFQKAKDIVESFLKGRSKEEKLIGVRILGECYDSPYALFKLLELISKEEKFLKEKYIREGYEFWDDIYESYISVKQKICFDDKLTDAEKTNLFKTDFFFFKEIEDRLRKFVFIRNDDFFQLIDKINELSITGRGFLVEIIGKLRSKKLEGKILDFLEKRLDPEIEPSIEVRTAAYKCLREWVEEEPDNSNVIRILKRLYENPTVSEDFFGFPDYCDDEYLSDDENTLFLSEKLWMILKSIKNKNEVEDSHLPLLTLALKAVVLELIKGRTEKSIMGAYTSSLIDSFKEDFGLSMEDKEEGLDWLFTGILYYKVIVNILNLFAVNGTEEAFKHLLGLLEDENWEISLLGAIGFEMSLLINKTRQKWHEKIALIDLKIREVINRLIKENKIDDLKLLAKLNKLKFKSELGEIEVREIITAILKRAKDGLEVEKFLIKALDRRPVDKSAIFSWLREIGSQYSAAEIKKRIKNLQVESNLEVIDLLRCLREKSRGTYNKI